MTDAILFEFVEHLADPENPSHAYCSECGTLKPTKDFMRKPTPLQRRVWGWDTKHDLKKKLYTGKECNVCARKRKARQKYRDYRSYDNTLRLAGLYEFLVPHPDQKKNPGKYITERERMIYVERNKGREAKKRGAIKGLMTRYGGTYDNLVKDVIRETDRVCKQIKSGLRIPECAHPYLEDYLVSLRSLIHEIRSHHRQGHKPHPTPNDYINPRSLARIETREKFAALSGEHKELVAKKYL